MDCKVCKEEILNLFDSNIEEGLALDIKAHLQHCPQCAMEYRKMEEVVALLKPKLQPVIPIMLQQNILQQIKTDMQKKTKKKTKTFKLNSMTKKILSVAAVLALIMLIVPFFGKNDGFMNNSAKAANIFLETTIKATREIKSMHIKLKVKTLARDNFELVGTMYGMVEHNIWKSFEKPEKWRVDKGERIAIFDGTNQYLWIPKLEQGIKTGKNANFIDWFKILLDPESILLKEQAGTKNQDSKFTMNESNGDLHMTITSKAQGNFINDYCKNKSIVQSDNRREYIFDTKTKLLKSLKIYILDSSTETLILETEKIEYNLPIDPGLFTISLPKGVEWTELTSDIESETFSNITSKRAAELIFDAMGKNNWDSINEVWQLHSKPVIVFMKKQYSGLKVIKIGESFKSGLYGGEFVPYEVQLSNGKIKKHNIALRNDNKNKVWVIDGGL